jgi:GHH signature containing HNH/Endo VII superfamily nuclease toxin  2
LGTKRKASSGGKAAKKPTPAPSASEIGDLVAANGCLKARRCFLKPYIPTKHQDRCCHPQTAHHLIEASAFFDQGRGHTKKGKKSVPLKGIKNYSEGQAPCVCAEGPTQNVGTHGLMHAYQSAEASKCPTKNIPLTGGGTVRHKATTYGAARDSGVKAMGKVFSESGCDPECVKKQLDNYHNQCEIEDKTPLKAVTTGGISDKEADAALVARAERLNPLPSGGTGV